MKLYTEEQVKEMLGKATIPSHFGGFLYNERQLLENATPIELPSDEDIEEASPKVNEHSHDYYIGDKAGFKDGAKWMKEQILNQNK